MIVKSDLKALAEEHGLISIGLTFYGDSKKYSAQVQWINEHGERVCELCERHTDTPDEAIASAVSAKFARSLDAEAVKRERIAKLRAELYALEGE